MSDLFVFGLGYSATPIALALKQAGWRSGGTVRDSAKKDALQAEGLAALTFDNRPAIEDALIGATHLLVSVPPGNSNDPVLAAHRKALQKARALRWIGYLSTIGVYGDQQGAWIDETTPFSPASDRAIARIGAETAWMALSAKKGVPLDIFRLSGIYGPGRSPLDRVRAGEARRIVKQGQVFNRIHLEDIVQTIATAMQQDRSASLRVFNVTDDEPAPPQDVILYAAKLMGLPPPPEIAFDSAELTPLARSFYSDNKRVRNDKIKRELGIALRYPTYREGLRSLVKS
jgi:nucleoside-diphosphate-sugar epimerase